ncbi:hypothetical protein XA68_17886 [Ophiocordyceps unilateralis]|uniref:NAD dependent epimerase/dehydratase n=1 Tax=Ophiocordyceps unilateralis TaxID=268505 RepID=A0A2A9PK19_OPHUN|nr:hypothetical protein XA68_17886 [Ophiocordyceps unilateralis]
MALTSKSSPPAAGAQRRVVPMRVIVCGVYRTGTMSMRTALSQLGFHECYHFVTVMENMDHHPQQWIRALEAKYAGAASFTKDDWDALLGRSQACCDVPAALFGVELAQTYPKAKVIILNRDPEAWYQSALNTIHSALNQNSLSARLTRLYCHLLDSKTRNANKLLKALFKDHLNFGPLNEKEKAIAWFKTQYEEFRQQIPAERRIEYRIQDGWKPLCDHLGVEIPIVEDGEGNVVEAPFPRLNDRQAFVKTQGFYENLAWQRANTNLLVFLGKMALAGGFAYCCMWAWTFLGRLG